MRAAIPYDGIAAVLLHTALGILISSHNMNRCAQRNLAEKVMVVASVCIPRGRQTVGTERTNCTWEPQLTDYSSPKHVS
jgi:hypothetical protein